MKSFNKNSGWLVKCVGGPCDGGFVRSWGLDPDPTVEADQLMRSFTVWIGGHAPIHPESGIDTRGEYRLVPTHSKDGERKLAKAGGVAVKASHYQWCEFEDDPF